MRDWAELDAEAMIDHVAHEAAGRPLYLVGHSFGGQLLGLIGAPERFAGAVLIASQLGYVGHWPAASRWALRLLWGAAVPALVAARGYVPGRLGLGGNDLPGGVASQWARWCRDPRYLLGEVPGAAAAFAAVRGPLLAYSFADDWMAPRPAVEALLATFRGAEVCHRHIDPRREGGAAVGHFGFFRQEAGGHLWPQVTAFLGAGARAPGEPVTPCHVAMQEVMADLAYGRA
jgi:predicted alpha/beta hydrolase